jgi:hypothetical protein
MKKIHESQVHVNYKSHDVLVLESDKGVKFKMTYTCENASERFQGELFVGDKWEHFFSLLDLGEVGNKSMYVRSESERRHRCVYFQKLGKKFFEKMMN